MMTPISLLPLLLNLLFLSLFLRRLTTTLTFRRYRYYFPFIKRRFVCRVWSHGCGHGFEAGGSWDAGEVVLEGYCGDFFFDGFGRGLGLYGGVGEFWLRLLIGFFWL